MKKSLEKNSVKYISHYNFPESGENRYCALSACTKVDYISKTLKKIGRKVTIISVSATLDKSYDRKTVKNKNEVEVHFIKSCARKNLFQKIYARIIYSLEMLRIALFEVKNGDTVIVYHSLQLIRFVSFIKRIKKINLIIEAEEIYGDVMEDAEISQKEVSYFQIADSYIFPTELMNSKINMAHKGVVINCGTYDALKTFDKEECRNKFGFEKDKIHIVYAGTLDPRKGGAEQAVLLASYLPENYHVHILGFGTQEEIENINKMTQRISEESNASISYDGVLSGEEYVQFLHASDIGLSTQNPSAKFNDTSFPSKILSYMSNGLRVVSVKIPVVVSSSVNTYMYYYENQIPEEIAKTIQGIDLTSEYKGIDIIKSLDDKFSVEIGKLLI